MMKTIKKIFTRAAFYLVFAAGLFQSALAQKETTPPVVQKAVGGVHGIWVICGNTLPKNFTYRIFRQKDDAAWQKVAEVGTPASKEEIQASLLSVQRTARIDIAPLDQERLQNLWTRVTSNVSRNSPPEIQEDIPLRAATGTAWYDANADSLALYRYKVQVITSKADGPDLLTNVVRYPQARFITDIQPVSVTPIATGITVKFQVVNAGVMTHCKIVRSYYLRSSFEVINADPIFINLGGISYITFNDETAAPKVPYTYAILPLDGAGNSGYLSPEAKAFNVPDKSIVPSVYNFRTRSDEVKKAIRLSWKMPDVKNVISIDIYRGDKFDGKYTKLASVKATDTTYFDYRVAPITTYFYTVKLNGYYETSPVSPRIPGILKASESNTQAPLAALKQDGNKVTISWARAKIHTHAWFIYRADGDAGIRQIAGPVISDSLHVTYTDSLPDKAKPMVYRYMIADENTSYAISPKSAPMYAYTNGLSKLPIPYNVMARRLNDKKVMIVWPDLRKQSKAFVGYKLYRRTGNAAPTPVTDGVISVNVNFYTDSLINKGEYFYSLKTISADGKTLSSASLDAGFTAQDDVPLMISNIRIFPGAKSVLLSWSNPMGQSIAGVQVFRATEGEKPQQIASLAAGQQSYTDKDLVADKVYYYMFTVKNSGGLSSPLTDPVGVHID